jgi:hypothetical protein
MIDRCEKSHQAENLSSFSDCTFCTSTAVAHHATMMYRISGCEEAKDLL